MKEGFPVGEQVDRQSQSPSGMGQRPRGDTVQEWYQSPMTTKTFMQGCDPETGAGPSE